MLKTYSEIRRFESFKERYEYLRVGGLVGESTFGFDRYLNQVLYRSRRWIKVRDEVIFRDEGCDLGVIGYEIYDRIIVHHMNPLTVEDIEDYSDDIFNPNFLICTSHITHLAIHYGDENLLPKLPKERKPRDTFLW